jgi:hypothetical protein
MPLGLSKLSGALETLRANETQFYFGRPAGNVPSTSVGCDRVMVLVPGARCHRTAIADESGLI